MLVRRSHGVTLVALRESQLRELAADRNTENVRVEVIACDLTLRGGPLDSRTAELAGLVSQVLADDEVDDAGLQLADELAQRSFNALSGTKRMLLAGSESAHLEAATCAETQARVLSNYWPQLRAAIAGFNADKH